MAEDKVEIFDFEATPYILIQFSPDGDEIELQITSAGIKKSNKDNIKYLLELVLKTIEEN